MWQLDFLFVFFFLRWLMYSFWGDRRLMKPTQSPTVLHTFSTSPKAELLYSQINIFHNTKQWNISISAKKIWPLCMWTFIKSLLLILDLFSLPQSKNRLKKKGTKVQLWSWRTLVSQTFLRTTPQIYMYIDLEITHMYRTVLIYCGHYQKYMKIESQKDKIFILLTLTTQWIALHTPLWRPLIQNDPEDWAWLKPPVKSFGHLPAWSRTDFLRS